MMSFTLPHLSKRVWLPLFCVTQKVNFRILNYSRPLGLASFQKKFILHTKNSFVEESHHVDLEQQEYDTFFFYEVFF